MLSNLINKILNLFSFCFCLKFYKKFKFTYMRYNRPTLLSMSNPRTPCPHFVNIIALGLIIVKLISTTTSTELGTINKFLPGERELIEVLEQIFKLTGNNGLDLLNMIQYFQKLQFFIIILISYNLIFLYLNVNKVEQILLKFKFIPKKIVYFYIKSLKLLQKSGILIVVCLFILLIISNYYSYYYLSFFIDNIDRFVELYFTKK